VATTPIANLVEGTTVVHDETGIHVTQPYLVTGLTMTTSGGTPLLQALNATGLPVYGDPHPDDSTIYVSRIEPKPHAKTSRTEAKVYVTWSSPTEGNLNSVVTRYCGITLETRTNREADGAVIFVAYSKPEEPASRIEVGVARTTKAQGVLTYDLLVTEDPAQYTEYLNGISARPWRDRDRYVWKCIDVQIEKVKFRPGYHLMMAFREDPDTHLEVCYYRTAQGFIPSDIELPIVMDPGAVGNGWRTVLPKGTFLIDFNNLTLPTSF
jgi:hypothetical protein